MAYAKKAGIEFVLAGEYPMPFEANFFDMVMIHDVLEHLHNSPRILLTELLRFVKPNGFFFATVPNAVNLRKRVNVTPLVESLLKMSSQVLSVAVLSKMSCEIGKVSLMIW